MKSVFRSGYIPINHFKAVNCQPVFHLKLTIGRFCVIMQIIEKGDLEMILRPHHLLCIQKYTGHGYDADFTANMNALVSELRANPNTSITIAQGCDALCKMCPNNVSGVCTSLEKVAIMDSAVLRICSLAYGQTVLWEEAALKARERIFETEEFHNICACCQWYDLCRRTEVRHE